MPQIYQAAKVSSDEEMARKEACWFDYDPECWFLVDHDAEVYDPDGHLLLSFRKNVIAPELCQQALDSFDKHASKLKDNRGPAAGRIRRELLPTYVGDLVDTDEFRTYYYKKSNGERSKRQVGNLAPSNVAGFQDPWSKDPNNVQGKCRTSFFTQNHVELWMRAIPFIQRIDQLYAELVPNLHEKQLRRAETTPQWKIADTAFSTITVNRNWRTAMHTDSGDYKEGFGNLVVCERAPNTYAGGYFLMPQYQLAVDVRNGDFLAADVHQWHCNSAIEPLQEDYLRMSVVCYLRHNLVTCVNQENPEVELTGRVD